MKDAADDVKKEELDVTVDNEAEEEEADSKAMSGLANLDEDSGADIDALVDAVMEKLEVDTGFELSGWAGRPTSQLKLGARSRTWPARPRQLQRLSTKKKNWTKN